MKKILFFFALLISFSCQAQIRVCQLPQVTTGTVNDYIIKEDSTCNGTRKIKVSDFLTTYGIGPGGGSTDTTSLSNRINALTNSKVDTIYKNSTKDSIIYTINSRRHAIKDSIGSSTTIDTTSLSNRINTVTNSKVDTVYKNAGGDSIVYVINSRRHAVEDVGGSGDMPTSTYDPQYFTDACLFGHQEISVDDAQDMVGTNTVWNLRDQPIKIVSGTTSLPTGIDHILTKIIHNPSSQYRYDNVCEAWVTALGGYVPCTYDVVTNKIQAKFPLFCFTASQSGTAAPTIGTIYINGFGITPTPSYVDVGEYSFTVTGLLAGISIPYISHITADGLYLISVIKTDNDSFMVTTLDIISQNKEDGALGGNYIEVEGIISNL